MTSHPQIARSSLLLHVLWILTTACLGLAIGVLTLRGDVHVPSGPALSDKVYHLAGFAALVLPTAILQPGWSLRVGLGSLLYGGIIEVIQPSFGRDAEWLDFIANGIGIVAGLILGRVLRRLALRLWRTSPEDPG